MSFEILDRRAIETETLMGLVLELRRAPLDRIPGVSAAAARAVIQDAIRERTTGDEAGLWLGREDGVATGLARLRRLPWDSSILGVEAGLLEIHMRDGDLDTRRATATLLINEALRGCRFEGLRFLATKVASDRFPTIHALEDSGFRLMDAEIVLAHYGEEPELSAVPGIDFLVFREREVRSLAEMGALFRMSRFFSDPRIGPERAAALWRASVSDSCRGHADEFMVALRGEEPLGFVTFKDDEALARAGGPRVRSLFHVGVAEEAQGQGIGKALLRNAVRHARKKADVVLVETQSRNAPALALYQRCGFRVVDSRFAFHLWLA
ncbi:MAG: GNAT family N-acetyltransferase [Planctomycetes bacterium]|nr:GNAT family N-acetyltransferase [Planctomycetota bacterium]